MWNKLNTPVSFEHNGGSLVHIPSWSLLVNIDTTGQNRPSNFTLLYMIYSRPTQSLFGSHILTHNGPNK